MKTNWGLFVGLAVFYVIMAIIYYYIGGEAVGITGMILSACLSGMIGFYIWFTAKRIGHDLPEDRPNAEIADGAGEMGFYSPHSWWPLPVALSATAMSIFRSSTSRTSRPSLPSLTPSSPKPPCWASNMASAPPPPTPWSSGRPSSATSPTTPKW